MSGSELLAGLRWPHPRAKRVLLISALDWGHERTADAIREAIASGTVDHLSKPAKVADESFHRAMSGFLYADEWHRVRQRSSLISALRHHQRGDANADSGVGLSVQKGGEIDAEQIRRRLGGHLRRRVVADWAFG
jgi:hypothetical protein